LEKHLYTSILFCKNLIEAAEASTATSVKKITLRTIYDATDSCNKKDVYFDA